MSTIVVGVDGSPESRAALRAALVEARLRGATVRAVYAFEAPPHGWPGLSHFVGTLREEAQRALNAALDEVLAEGDPGVPVEREVVEGPAPRALVRAAEGADLLVVGARGRGGFPGLRLGSVSQQCAHHASCPVIIVHPRSARGGHN